MGNVANIPVTTAVATRATATKNTVAQVINPSDNIKMKACPIENTFKIIGKKFAVLILRNMINGKQNRFNQLLNSIEQGNPKTLTIRLREMEKSGLIKRKVYHHETPVRIEYYPTEKGLALKPILDMMAAYSMKYCSKDIFKDAKPRDFKEIYGRDIAKIPQLN
ncbi:MAG: winged helix-turn-helix transcriptional regulator [Nitrososphaeraceae archaeon]